MLQVDVKPISYLSDKIDEFLLIFSNSNTPGFFAHPLYLTNWWKHLGRGEGKLLVIKGEHDEYVGYLAVFKESDTTPWRVVGAKDESDYLDITTLLGFQEKSWEALLAFWQKNKAEWKDILLECIPDSSTTKETLKIHSGTYGFAHSLTQQDVCPVIRLPKTWDEYTNTLDPSLKKRLKRFTQSIQEDDSLTFKKINNPEEIATLLPTFIALHKASGPEKNSFWTPQREAFFLEMPKVMAEKGLVRLEVLEVSDDPAAMLLSFIYKGKLLGYNSGFNQYRYGHLGVGTVLVAHSIEEAIKDGLTHYDFMRGNEPYKLEFGAKAEPVWDATLS